MSKRRRRAEPPIRTSWGSIEGWGNVLQQFPQGVRVSTQDWECAGKNSTLQNWIFMFFRILSFFPYIYLQKMAVFPKSGLFEQNWDLGTRVVNPWVDVRPIARFFVSQSPYSWASILGVLESLGRPWGFGRVWEICRDFGCFWCNCRPHAKCRFLQDFSSPGRFFRVGLDR